VNKDAPKQAQPRRYRLIKGHRDLLPPETALWAHVERIAHEVFRGFGFGEIRPAILETAELFEKSVGTDTDIVGKELYSWVDSPASNKAIKSVRWKAKMTASKVSEPESAARLELKRTADAGSFDTLNAADRVVLRPEATASVCRAYIEHGMQQLTQPVKLYYMGPMFRRERPQKGRYRQFFQIGAEVLGGDDAPAIDAEVIQMVVSFFERLELRGVRLEINSIGCQECRGKYVEILRSELEKVKDKLGEDSQRRIETNPLRVLDSKLEDEQAVIETLPKIYDRLCKDCAIHYEDLKTELRAREVAYHENWRLVRGLDYYMRTTFEITAQGLGSQDAVCGGGRYDGLVEMLGGPSTKGIGFAIGEDRLVMSLQAGGKTPSFLGVDVFIVRSVGADIHRTAIRAARSLRNVGLRVELPPTAMRFGKALERASKVGSRFALILGDDEVSSGQWTLKNLANSEQQKLSEQALLNYLKSL
jgi:histidyl-tRNA synthetase